MKKILLAILLCCSLSPVCAQNSKKVKALKAQQSQLQKNLKQSQRDLAKTKKDVQKGQTQLHHIGVQLDDRLSHIRNMEDEMTAVEGNITNLRGEIVGIDAQLQDRKQKYIHALRFSRQFPKIKSPLLFILSAKTVTQMYRCARYAQEYIAYQYNLGRQIMIKHGELMEAQNQLLAAKSRVAGIIRDVMQERRRLNDQQVAQTKVVAGLQKKQKGLKSQVAKQQKELNALNKKIDDLIAYEIEQARRRAEEAARKKAEAEARRKAEAAAKAAKKNASASTGKETTPTKESSTAVTTPSTVSRNSWLTAQDRQINGSFESNKGRLPVPITGQYMIGNHFGAYNVPGLSHVTLDNKGTNYVGKPGARARCIFDGEVTAVFQFAGSKNVLVRHGSYISVYCNLSSVIVSKGQKLHTRDIIGTVMNDGSGECVLHFQLRKETAKLNPEAWIGR